MRDDRQKAFLLKVRQALGKPAEGGSSPYLFDGPLDDPEARLARYRERTPRQRQALLEELKARAGAVAMGVSVVGDAAAAGAVIRDLVLHTVPEWGSRKRVVAWDHPLLDEIGLAELLTDDGVPVTVTRLDENRDAASERRRLRREVESAYIGITSADFVVAHTATMVLRSRPGHLRSVSLVPSIHVCVADANRLVADLGELYTRLQWEPEEKKQGLTNCLTFISAPSKTGDIELVMVDGAHGPRQVQLVLISP